MVITSSDKTFLIVFQLTEILISDMYDSNNFSLDIIREKIEIAIEGLSKSRKLVVEVDREKVVMQLWNIYGSV